MLAAFVYFSYIAINLFNTPSLDSLETLTGSSPHFLPRIRIKRNPDPQAYIFDPTCHPSSSSSSAISSNSSTSSRLHNQIHPLLLNSLYLPSDGVPALHDLPLGFVNRVVFGDHRRSVPGASLTPNGGALS